MDLLQKISLENRLLRHGLFWIAWIIGFTFIKSFGAKLDIYLGWLVYYILTLPIFVIHTYLIVYWAAKKFLKGSGIIVFIILFILLMSGFSFIELVVTDEFLSIFFPKIFSDVQSYLDPGNVLISGIGNLYIILVFSAAKMMREWYISDHRKQMIVERSLYLKRADVNARVQPGMLLFSIGQIEKLVAEESDNVPGAIALLSELLNAVMQAQKVQILRVDEEVKNLKRMFRLYSLLLDTSVPKLRIEGEDLYMKSLPAFILFSPLEIIYRNSRLIPGQDILITLNKGLNVEISWEYDKESKVELDTNILSEEMDMLYPQRFQIESQTSENQVLLNIKEVSAETKSLISNDNSNRFGTNTV
jgi:hypothetical protein